MTPVPHPARRRASILAGLGLATQLIACSTTYTNQFAEDGVVLARRALPDGAGVLYKLKPGDASGPRIHRFETRAVNRAELGIRVLSIDDRIAAGLKVPAHRGVVVDDVTRDGPAARSGVVKGDILLSIDGTTLSSEEQLKSLLETQLRPGTPASIIIQRWQTTPERVWLEDLPIRVTPLARDETVTSTDSIKLDTDLDVQHFTGMQLGVVTGDLALEVFRSTRPVILVCGVVPGSPAYLAGLRGGDRIRAFEGHADLGIEAVHQAVMQRTTDGEDASSMPVTVTSEALGDLDTELEVTFDLEESHHFEIPILFDYSSRASATSWSFLDFIVQFGATYSSEYLGSSTREPTGRTELSLLPFGMFEFESSPTFSRYTFLWLIDWTTHR